MGIKGWFTQDDSRNKQERQSAKINRFYRLGFVHRVDTNVDDFFSPDTLYKMKDWLLRSYGLSMGHGYRVYPILVTGRTCETLSFFFKEHNRDIAVAFRMRWG